MASKKQKRRASKKGAAKKKNQGTGVMRGMRSGFKGAADAVTGKSEPKTKRGKLIGSLLTVALVAVAAFVLYRRFG